MKKIDNFTKEEIQKICSESRGYAEVAEKIGYERRGGAGSAIVKSYIEENNIDISNFLGHGWNKNNFDFSRFKKGQQIKEIKKVLLNIRPYMCEICKCTEWMGSPIPLVVHHIDGDHLNNEFDNLQLLCPNCHAQTDNYCGKNISNTPKVTEEQFKEALEKSSSIKEALKSLGINYSAGIWYKRAREIMNKNGIVQKKKSNFCIRFCIQCGKKLSNRTKGSLCLSCYNKSDLKRKIQRPTRDELLKDIIDMSFVKIGLKYGVCDKTIVKWCRDYGLPESRKAIREYVNHRD